MSMEAEVAQFMRGIESTVLCRFVRVQKNVWNVISPTGESIDFQCVLGQGEDSDTLRLEQIDHVPDWLLANAPSGA
jgi:hypothetical protein